MRIFRKAANIKLRQRRLAGDLSKLGLGDNLRRYYSEVRAKLPAAKLHGF